MFVKDAGVWKLNKLLYVKDAGAWKDVQECWVKSGGVWKLAHKLLIYGASTTNVNLHAAAGSPSNPYHLSVVINSGFVIGSTSTGAYAMDTSGMPAGSSLYLYVSATSYIVGKGGNGGPGGGGGGSNGQAGGPALNITVPTYLDGGGVIGGGGGGGAGGATWPGHDPYIGGGGGGAGSNVGTEGPDYPGGTFNGNPGTLTNGGTGGGGHCGSGTGGNLGQPGTNTGNCDAQPGATGGAAGKAINLNGNSLTYISITVAGAVS